MSKPYKLKKFGPITKRRSYSTIPLDLEIPNLLEVQTNSFQKFVTVGIKKEINNLFPIYSHHKKIEIHFLQKTLKFIRPNDIKVAKAKELKLAKQQNRPKLVFGLTNEIKKLPKTEYEWLNRCKQKGISYSAKIIAILLQINETSENPTNETKQDFESHKVVNKNQTKVNVFEVETGEIVSVIDIPLLIQNLDLLTKTSKTKLEVKKAKKFGIIVSKVIFGTMPLMTNGGYFLVNGSKKVVVSQLVRSPGIYFSLRDRRWKQSGGNDLFNSLEILPQLGSWIEVFHRVTGNLEDWVKVKIDNHKTFAMPIFLKALGFKEATFYQLFGESSLLSKTLSKTKDLDQEAALKIIHKTIYRDTTFMIKNKFDFLPNIFFNKRRYSLSRTGRYIINNALNLVERITNTILAKDLVGKKQEVLFKAKIFINYQIAQEIQEAFVNKKLKMTNLPDIDASVYGSQLLNDENLKFRIKVIMVDIYPDKASMLAKKPPIRIIANDCFATENHLLVSDFIAAISYYFNMNQDIGSSDDVDSLVNKRIINVGEQLQNQFKIALFKLEKNARERMYARESWKITPKSIINNKPVDNQFKTFFNSSQLSQFLDQVNPLAEISNKRRITSLGPGGLKNRETVQLSVRDVHRSHYGRICPIETPEGLSIGLILSFANYARVNELGFIETPYFPVKNGVVIKKAIFLTTNQEKDLTFAQATTKLGPKMNILDNFVVVRKNQNYEVVAKEEVNYIDVSTNQISSISSSCIPFLENDDASRLLMGANMQRQAVPLLQSEAPYVSTGNEALIGKYSTANLKANNVGVVSYVDARNIVIKNGSKLDKFQLKNFEKTNQNTIMSQKPIVKLDQKIKKDEIIADGSCFDKGELALGKNVLVAFTVWKGFNFEDAIIISERLVKDDVYSSVHIEEYSLKFRKSKVGDDELTNEIPNVSRFAKRFLDKRGIVTIGSDVIPGDVLIGRISPKGEENITPEEKLIAAIFSQRHKNFKDTSLKVKPGQGGTIIDVQILSKENKVEEMWWLLNDINDIVDVKNLPSNLSNKISKMIEIVNSKDKNINSYFRSFKKLIVEISQNVLKNALSDTMWNQIDNFIYDESQEDELEDGINKIVKVHIAQKRKIKVGDKMAGRHGNKGVVSCVLPIEDMPHLEDGTPIDIMLNPLGVPSRMNIGQVFELHLGLAAKLLNTKFVTPIFDGIKVEQLHKIFEEANLPKSGKFKLFDPILCKQFDNEVTVGVMYMLKLSHMVDDKMHARSIGPYALITQQPLGGKSQNGGQRFGEMETWAIESYGAANILQEILTYKSDDIKGRNRIYHSIVENAPMPKPGMPESTNVLAYELRGLGLKLELNVDNSKFNKINNIISNEKIYKEQK